MIDSNINCYNNTQQQECPPPSKHDLRLPSEVNIQYVKRQTQLLYTTATQTQTQTEQATPTSPSSPAHDATNDAQLLRRLSRVDFYPGSTGHLATSTSTTSANVASAPASHAPNGGRQRRSLVPTTSTHYRYATPSRPTTGLYARSPSTDHAHAPLRHAHTASQLLHTDVLNPTPVKTRISHRHQVCTKSK